MPNRETWDWQTLEPDKTVTMVMLFDRTPKDDGRKEGADYDWHRYPVSVGKTDWTMFTPSELMHSALQALGVNKKGDVFRATKKLGYKKDTGKSYTCYEVEVGGKKLRTDQRNNQPPKPKEETETPISKSIKDPQLQPSLKEIHKQAYFAVMDNILEYIKRRCPALYEREMSQDETQIQERMNTLIVDLQPYISSMVNTLVIEGGKR